MQPPGIGFGSGTGSTPPAVFGRPHQGSHAQLYTDGGSTGGSGRLGMTAATQTDPTANVVDLTPLGGAARGHPPVRTVALQVSCLVMACLFKHACCCC